MKLWSRILVRLALVFVMTIFGSSFSHASLGGPISSIESDRQALNGQIRTSSHGNYSISDISQDGTTVHEYRRTDGTVFAVSWRGLTQPDLSVILGSYYQEYRDADLPRSTRQARGARVIRSDNLVMERSGHMRDVRGKAYVPALLPQGFKAEEIQ